jgi:DNA polymerase III epsilon subunit family exonuclease
MAKQPPIRVALDLETTGLHAEQDVILEVAAIKFQGETILDKMETLIAPGRPIPFRVQRLTGITPQSVANAPDFDSISGKLQQFLGDYPLVGHSIPFDAGFLRRRGLVRNNPLIDTFELATVLLPSLPSYGLGHVALALGVPVAPGRHRAMVDTILAMDVFLALHRLLQAVDTPILKGLAHLDAPRAWPLLGFFRQEWRERVEQDGLQHGGSRGSLGDRFAAQLGMDPRILSFALARQQEAVPVTTGITPAEATGETFTSTSQPPLEGADVESIFVGRETTPAVDALQTLVEVIPEEVQQQESTHSLAHFQEADEVSGIADHGTPRHAGYRTAYRAIQHALSERTPLLLEVTVGANDYSPALLPALEWLANAHKDRKDAKDAPAAPPCLVISTATAQSARRLMDRLLPQMQESLQSALPVAYLAESGGYLCMHRWFGPALRRTSGELTAEQARGVAKLAIWAQQTQSGERSELTLLPQEIAAWERISSGVEHVTLADSRAGTPAEHCLYRKNGYCFSSRAEERVKQASIVVTTHAGLLDDLTSSRSLLKGIPHRLILDADLLEEECARWSNEELDHTRLKSLLHTIGTELPDGRYQGLLALAAPSLSEDGPGGLSTTPTVEKSALDARVLTWFQSLRQAQSAIDSLFKALGQLLQEGASGGMRDKGKQESAARGYGARGAERTDQPFRLTPQMRNLASWMEVDRAWQVAAQRLKSVMHVLDEAQKTILANRRGRHRLDPGSGEEESIAWELADLAHRLFKQKKLAEQALAIGKDTPVEQEDTHVYWLRMPPPVTNQGQLRSFDAGAPGGALAALSIESMPVLHAQDPRTSSIIKTHLLPQGVGAVLAGVALSVDHNFSYYRGRYGLDADSCPALSVVTEYQQQTLLYMPNDVPEPNAPQYQRHLDEAITHLATTLEGQLVVLFTSYAALRSSYATIKPLLEAKDILVLGHGIDGSPRQLWQMFSDQSRVVLLGTGSFWDGIDEVSHPPTCVMVARLPMPVLNDPPFAARVEHYSDQLHQVTVPIASLRVRRALNRLAWSDTRRNAVVLFDRRVLSKEYGSTVIHSLPQCSQRQGGVSHMPEIVLDWLTATGAWD